MCFLGRIAYRTFRLQFCLTSVFASNFNWFSIFFDSILTSSSYKNGYENEWLFSHRFFKEIWPPFDAIWFHLGSLWLPLGSFWRKMETKERARFVPKWGPPCQGASDPPPDPILEVLRVDFETLLDPLGHALGRFWETFLASCLVFCCFWGVWGSSPDWDSCTCSHACF